MKWLNAKPVALFVMLLYSGITDAQETLPRVLILGDSVYQQHARTAVKELKGQAEVVFATLKTGQVFSSKSVVENLDSLLGNKKWDVIHFNCGLGDLVYRVPKLKSFRAMPKSAGGVRNVGRTEYEKNLRLLVAKLKATGAKLVWASTTPVRSSPQGLFDLKSEIDYNKTAAKVMADNNVSINDMHSYVASVINMKRPASADPFAFDKKPLHPPLVKAIVAALK